MSLPTLRGEDIVLRPFRVSDAATLAEEVGDAEIVRWMTIELPVTVEDAERFILDTQGAWDKREAAHFAIAEDPGGPMIGYLGVLSVEDSMRAVEIGYWVARHARAKGVARSALRLALDWIPDAIGPERIELGMAKGNEASARVAEACGFVLREVVAGGVELHGAKRDEWIFELPVGH